MAMVQTKKMLLTPKICHPHCITIAIFFVHT
jgi:hypothetical protein